MSKKIIILIIIVVLGLGGAVGYRFFGTRGEPRVSFAVVEKGDIVEKVSATGSLVPQQRVAIESKAQGQVAGVFVEVGEKVKQGQVLIQLDQAKAKIAVQKARANLRAAEDNVGVLEKRLENANQALKDTKETMTQSVNKALADIETAKIALAGKEQALKDAIEQAEINLSQALEDAETDLDSNLAVAEKALLELDAIIDDYFLSTDQISLKVKDKKQTAEDNLDEAEAMIAQAESKGSEADIGSALAGLQNALESINDALRYTRNTALETQPFKSQAASADKTTLDTEKNSIETAIADIVAAEQNIASAKIANTTAVNTAQSAVNTAKANLDAAKSNLEYVRSQKVQSIATAESNIKQITKELALQRSQVQVARAGLAEALENLEDTVIMAPLQGTITQVDIEEGETAKLNQTIIEMITGSKFKIEADISEVDIGDLKTGDRVEVNFDAFPDQEFEGKVIKIYPAEIVKQGAIYYRIEVGLLAYPDNLKSGLTANLDIIIAQKKNVLTIPYIALNRQNRATYVDVLQADGSFETRKVGLGIEGETKVEVVDGLAEGERVVTYVEK